MEAKVSVFMNIIQEKNRIIESWLKIHIIKWLLALPKHANDQLTSARSLLNLPNILSYLRGILIIPMLMLIYDQQYFGALLIFLVGMFLDFIDGPMARALNCVSDFGKLLDPLMDKLIFFAVLIAFFQEVNLIIFISLTVSEGLLILHPGIKLYLDKKISGANIFGKYKMNFQTAAVILLLINPHSPKIVFTVNLILIGAAFLSILSFIGHLKKLTA